MYQSTYIDDKNIFIALTSQQSITDRYHFDPIFEYHYVGMAKLNN